MIEKREIHVFRSGFSSVLDDFVRYKRACGYSYDAGAALASRLDKFLCEEKWGSDGFPRALLIKWISRRANERPTTQDQRKSIVRQICLFLRHQGEPVDISFIQQNRGMKRDFVPRIFSFDEIKRLIAAVDDLQYTILSPMRHLVMPEYFRLLYFCGLRNGEVRRLRMQDVDMEKGLLTIRDAKGGKDRLIPPAQSIVHRLRRYASFLSVKTPNAFFFPAPDGGTYGQRSIYGTFREMLIKAGISHEGRGKGPRVHDLRHSFAVHRLIQWYKEGANLNAKLSVLADYMGHKTLEGTQHYLYFTAELFPELTARSEKSFGHVIPGRRIP